jgi:hypothetical protein
MVKNKHATRAFIAFLVTWSFVVLTVTGLVLYVVPHGRVATWTFWSLAGLPRDGWADVHILFGAVFIVGGALHLYFNWKPFMSYLAERVSGHVALKRESLASLLATVLLIVAAVYAIPPVSWLFDLNDTVKSAWGRAPGHEPPYPRAEETPLPVLAKRLEFDRDAALAALKAAGLRIDDPGATLAAIATANATTPAAVYALIPRPAPVPSTAADPLEIETRLTGTGVGAKTLAAFAEDQRAAARDRPRAPRGAGDRARAEETLKAIAERQGIPPIELAKALLAPGYRPRQRQ